MCTPKDNASYVFDRVEEGLFVLTDERGGELFVRTLCEGAKAGDTLIFKNGRFMIDQKDSAQRSARIDDLLGRLFK